MADFKIVHHKGLHINVPGNIGTLEAIDRERATVSFTIRLPYSIGRRMSPGDRVRVNWAAGVVLGTVEDDE